MLQKSCVPDVRISVGLDSCEHFFREIVHLSAPVLRYGTVFLTAVSSVSIEAGQNLIYENFLIHYHRDYRNYITKAQQSQSPIYGAGPQLCRAVRINLWYAVSK